MQKHRNLSFWMQTALAIVETGSPTGAAKQLGASITTVYRHIDALEQWLELPVFERRHSGWRLREEASALLIAGKEIDRLLVHAQSELREASAAGGGNLRIAVSDDLAVHYVASRLRLFCERYGNLQPDLIVSSDFVDLVHGEADVAIRPDMDPGDTLVGHRVGYMTHAFYASHHYIEQHGRPSSVTDLAGHQFCGYGAALGDYTAARWLNDHVPAGNIAARFGTTTIMTGAVAESVGIGLLPCFVGDAIPSVEAIMKIDGAMPIDIWLVTAAAGRKRGKIQAFFKFFRSVMRTDAPLFKGQIYRV